MKPSLSKKDLRIIKELKLILKGKSPLIDQIYCYGSRILSHNEDADFDILTVTSTKINWEEEQRIYSETFRYGIDNDIQFDVKFFSSEELNTTYRPMPFIKNVLSYGISV